MIKFYSATSTKTRKQKFLNVYNQAFPQNEVKPLFLPKYRGLKKCVVFDGDLFVGICVYKDFGECIFVAYLAVEQPLRDRGIGGKILEYLKNFNKPIALNVECKNNASIDGLQRIKFYSKNNFKLHDYVFDWEGVQLQTMVYGKIDIKKFLKKVKHYFNITF